MIEENQEVLLEKIESKKKEYDWISVVNNYNKLAENFIQNNLMEHAAESFKSIGYYSFLASHIIDSSDKHLEYINKAISAYKEAAKIFKQIGNNPRQLECEAEVFFINGYIQDSFIKAESSFQKAAEIFKKVRQQVVNKLKKEDILKITIREAVSLSFQQICSRDGQVKQNLSQEVFNLLPTDLNFFNFNIQAIAETIYYCYFNSLKLRLIQDFKWDESFWEKFENLFLIYEQLEGLKLLEQCTDSRSLGMIYFSIGHLYWYFGFEHILDESQQMEYINIGLDLLKKSIEYIVKTNDKSLIIQSILYLDWDAMWTGEYKFVQDRIENDIEKILKYETIYTGSFSKCEFNGNFLPALYYTAVSYMKNFPLDQRLNYAKEGIKFAKGCLNRTVPLPISIYFYQLLTFSYSFLSYLTKDPNEKEKNANKMLQYAQKAGELGEKYEGGHTLSFGYSCLYRAYKTLADISKNKKEKIQMLKNAIEVSEKYLEHPVEFKSGNIEAYLRLGVLNEELGILIMDHDILLKAKDVYLYAIRETRIRGYDQHKATAHEYLARLENRIGNTNASAKNYKKAKKAYTRTLEKIDYIPIKNRIKDKINYTEAWFQIESAKSFHKDENHLRSKTCYEKASKILKEIANFNYEAPYYHAWALLEEAENYSKQELQRRAIEYYKLARDGFEKAIKSLENTKNDQKEVQEIKRINSLEKVANVRIKYCSARIHLEEARLLGKSGKHTVAAENFAIAASLFYSICILFKSQEERRGLEAIYFLCKAWEAMELGNKYEEIDRFTKAADLFVKASEYFTETKLKLLALGNSSYCKALENGCKFDQSDDIEFKKELFYQIKALLRNAASAYGKGGFKNGSNWALATSSYFDALWHLIIADKEMNIIDKKRLLRIGYGYFKEASILFSKAGYSEKEKEIINRMEIVEKEEKILISALNTIKDPPISISTKGIVAPSCPIETSITPNIEEIREITLKSREVLAHRKEKRKVLTRLEPIEKTDKKKEIEIINAEVSIEDRDYFCIVHKGPIIGANYLCPHCKTFYCERCAQVLKENNEKCWTCNNDIDFQTKNKS